MLSTARILVLLSFAIGQTMALHAQQSAFTHFLTKYGTRLMTGGEEYRFLGLVAPNLHQNEPPLFLDFTAVRGTRYRHRVWGKNMAGLSPTSNIVESTR